MTLLQVMDLYLIEHAAREWFGSVMCEDKR